MAARRLQFTPNVRPTSTRTPSKNSLDDAGLYLQQVIGTTSISSNGFAYLESARCFAFLAGAGAVLASVDDDLRITQRFYRAKSFLNSAKPTTPFYEPPTLPGAPQPLRRGSSFSKREGLGGLPSFGPSAADLVDSPGNRTSSLKERTKAASCVCLSPNGKILALGETGHKPKILLFATARGSPSSNLLASLSEHTFGIRCLAFSPNSSWLASLGDINDGFLYIWAVNTRTGNATLHASNRCTSSVKRLAWLGNSLITVGTRHVKVWRVECNSGDGSDESGPGSPYSPLQTLPGRNCVLGALLERTFTVVLAVGEGKAIICSDQGDICLFDDTGLSPNLLKVAHVEFAIHSAVVHSDSLLLVGGDQGHFMSFTVDNLLNPRTSEGFVARGTTINYTGMTTSIIALASFNDLLITLDCRRTFRVLKVSNDESPEVSSIKNLPAHGAAVLGAQPLTPKIATLDASYLTWSTEGSILFWDVEGVNVGCLRVPLRIADAEDETMSNELKIVCAIERGGYLISGDKHGWLRCHEIASGAILSETRAHLGEITDLSVVESTEQTLVASSGRDRMVQVFRFLAGNLELLQTLDEHVGVVTGVMFTKDASKLISYSADRTIVMREDLSKGVKEVAGTAFVAIRTITLKSAPISAVLSSDNEETLFVSTTDRRVQGFQANSGRLVIEFKTCDVEGGDSVILNCIRHLTIRGYPVIAGVSSSDKSIRLYDDSGRLVAREYGPTGGMTGLTVFSHESKPGGKGLVTVAADGTIFIWDLSSKSGMPSGESPTAELGQQIPKINVLVGKPPLRRILSATEVARLQSLREDAAGLASEPLKNRRMSPERRSPERQLSRLSLMSTPRLDSSPNLKSPARDRSPLAEARSRRLTTTSRLLPAPPQPVSGPKVASCLKPLALISPTCSAKPLRRRSLGSIDASREVGTLAVLTDELCLALQSYRSRVGGGLEVMPYSRINDLGKELSMTAHALAEKCKEAVGEGAEGKP